MTDVIDKPAIQADGQPADEARYKTLQNGAVYDLQAKKIVSGAVLSSDRAREMVAARETRRREAARQAANQAVDRADFHAAYGDLAYLAAIIETAMQKATTADDPKAIEAARFIMQQTGDQADGQPGSQAADERGILSDLAAIARAILAESQTADVIDGHAADV
jgi:hypothetical protein